MKNKLLFNLLMPFATSNTEGKTFRNLIALVMVVVGMGSSWGQIYVNQFTGVSACPTNGNTPTMVTNSVGASLTRSTVTCNNTANVFSSTTINNTSSISNTSYIEFSATANNGYILNLTSVSFFRQGSNTAPNQIEVKYSTDGFSTSTTWGSAPITPTTGTIATWDFTDFSTANGGTVTFRIYPYGTTSCNLSGTSAATGTFRVDDVTINGSVSSDGGPNITQTGLLNTFISSAVTSPSAEQNFTIAGTTLTNDIVITPPTGYQISTSTGGSFSPTNPITLTQSNGTVATTTIYARFNPTALTDQVGGNITISSTGATTQNVAVSGEVTNLSAGAIAFIAFQGQTTDLYRIVALNDIPNNTRIWFTDKAWDGNGGTLAFTTGEGNNVWTNTTGSAIAAGTVIQFDAAGAATLGTGGLSSGLGSGGEQLFAYQGTLTSPTFLAGYTSGTVISTGVPVASGTETWLPSGLTSGTNFVALGGTYGSSYVTAATHNRSLADMRSHIHTFVNLTTGLSTPTNGSWPTYTFNISNNWTGANGNWNTAGNWSLATVPSSSDHVTISSGSPVLDVDYTLPAGKTLTLSGTGGLTINPGKILTIAGTADFGGNVVTFKSDVTGTAMLGTLTGTLSDATNVKVERYIPARRAFRFLSPSVTTSTSSIKENWQENGGSTAGLGTHITGVDGITNGFDATSTNNPSLFTFNNSTGSWVAVTSTLLPNTLTAGTPYRLMVRGDRSIDMSTNSPSPTPTVLRATGTLHTGNFPTTLNQAAQGFSFIGNPYQAPLDIKTALQSSTDVNKNVVYYWDPTINARGGYITRNLQTSQNSPSSSVNDYIQPGQAFFVVNEPTLTSAPALTFTENHKSVANAAAGVFRNANTNDYGILRVNLQANTNNQWVTIDGALAIFNDTFSWNVTSEDATKMANLDEEVSFVQNNTSLAIALQTNPSATSELPIKIGKMRHTNYKWQFELDNYDGATPYLFDMLNNSYTQINNGTVVPFTADANTTNRFKIVFQNALLSTDTFATQVGLYPNPSKGNGFYLQLPSTAQATVRLYNTLGQEIAISHNEGHYQANQSLAAGVYHIMVTQGEKTSKLKWIVE